MKHVILNHVDTPLKILFWTTGELLMWFVPCFLGLILNQLILGLIISVIGGLINKKYQQHFGKGQFQAVKYWFLPPDVSIKLPKSYVRTYLG